jgi:hypothetical protein
MLQPVERVLYVPAGTVAAYYNSDWKDWFGSIREIGTTLSVGSVKGKITGAPSGTAVQLWLKDGSTKSGAGVTWSVSSAKASVPAGYTLVAVTATDADGNYVFDQLPAGEYIVIVVMEGYDSTPSNPITLADGATAGDVNFTVKGATITPDGVTGVSEIERPNPLKAWTRDGLLHVTGLTVGEPLSVYSATGVLVYQNMATSDEADIPLAVQGVYVVRQGDFTIKVAFNH